MSKMKKQFKEKIMMNKVKTEQKRNEFLEKRYVTIEVEDVVAKVDRGSLFVKSEEVEEVVRDLFYTNTEIKENSIIELDRICDVCYRLVCNAIKGNEILFSLS